MKVIYRPHLKIRLKARSVPQSYPKRVYLEANKHYQDISTGHRIAISKLKYFGELRNMVICYDIIESESVVEIITIHPLSNNELKNKISRGRWKKI